MSNFWLAILGILLIAVAFEAYPPLGVSLAAIAIITMILR